MKREALGVLVFLASCTHGKLEPRSPGTPVASVQEPPPISDEPATEPLDVDVPSCATPEQPALITSGNDTLSLTKVGFSELPGWRKDRQGEAIEAFAASCEKLSALDDDAPVGTGPYGGVAAHWRHACEDVKGIGKDDHAKARAFFEEHFYAYAAEGEDGPQGRITGYYVQPLRGSRKRGGRYQFPLYKRPADLVAVKLNDFVDDGRSRRLWGRISPKSGRLVPYPTREEFRQSPIGQTEDAVLLWLDNPVDVVLVEIEGSGRVTLDDGSVAMVGFAGKNGRKSERGGVARALRRFLTRHGKRPWKQRDIARYYELIAHKTSMVFFELEARTGAIGSQNVVLTPRRSLAVDRAIVPLSTPIWVDTAAPDSANARHAPWRHLLIAQDTGGAIIGSVRGDIYWGDDQEAVAIGRRVNGAGRMWLLLPKAIPAAPVL